MVVIGSDAITPVALCCRWFTVSRRFKVEGEA